MAPGKGRLPFTMLAGSGGQEGAGRQVEHDELLHACSGSGLGPC